MRWAVILPALAIGSCATVTTPPGAISVAQLLDNAPNLVGKKVTIVGFIGPCVPLSCAIGDQRDVWSDDNAISIGAAPEFDRKVNALKGRRVFIRADFTGSCVDLDRSDDVIPVCADRGDTLSKPEFIGFAPK